jgi:hypothetical protein
MTKQVCKMHSGPFEKSIDLELPILNKRPPIHFCVRDLVNFGI